MNDSSLIKFLWSIFLQLNGKCWCCQHKHRSSNARISIPSSKDYRFTRNRYFDSVHCWLFTKMYHLTIKNTFQYNTFKESLRNTNLAQTNFKTLPQAMTSFNELNFTFTSLNWRVAILPLKYQIDQTICMGFHLKWNITCSSDPDHLFKKVLQMSYLWSITRSAVHLDLINKIILLLLLLLLLLVLVLVLVLVPLLVLALVLRGCLSWMNRVPCVFITFQTRVVAQG